MEAATQNVEEKTEKAHAVTIKVNGNDVTLQSRKATGMQIKQAAIAQGVAIQPDFNLYRRVGGKLKLVPDSETIELHDNEEFKAVTPEEPS